MQDNTKHFQYLLRKNKIVIEITVPSATVFIKQRDRYSNEIKDILFASFWKLKATT